MRRPGIQHVRGELPRSLVVSASIHALLLGTGALWGVLHAGYAGPERVTRIAAVVPRPHPAELDPVEEPEPPEEAEALFEEPDLEGELVETVVTSESEPPIPRPPLPWEDEALRAVDFDLPRSDLTDLLLTPDPARGAASTEVEADAALVAAATVAGNRCSDPVHGSPVAAPRIEAASPLETPPPVYPRLSVRAGEEGRVLCRIHLSDQGLVVGVDVIESSGFPRLDRAAVEALSAWRFRPRLEDDRPVASEVLHRVVFELTI